MDASHIGLYGGIAGGIVGFLGGVVGTVYSIRRAHAGRERKYTVYWSLAFWFFTLLYGVGLYMLLHAHYGMLQVLLPVLYGAIIVPAMVLLYNKNVASFRKEEDVLPYDKLLPCQDDRPGDRP